MLKKNVIYTRYSTDMQSPKSCTDQEREIRAALTKKGIDTSDAIVIDDQAESGTKTFRAEFERLQAMTRAGELGWLAVDDQSRVSRAATPILSSLTSSSAAAGSLPLRKALIPRRRVGSCGSRSWSCITPRPLMNSAGARRGQHGRLLAGLTAGDFPTGMSPT